MHPVEFTEHPLFIWAKACCELRGIQAILTKLNYSREFCLSTSSDHCKKRRSLNTDFTSHHDHIHVSKSDPLPERTEPGSTGLPFKADCMTYADLCAGIILYACIRYIDSKEDVDAGILADEAKRDLVILEETFERSENVDVPDGNDCDHYGRTRRHSSPAVRLTTTFREKSSSHLSDGSNNDEIVSKIGDVAACRLRNLRTVMRRIQNFYADSLNALIVMPLPDLLLIARNPFAEDSGEEMKKVLLLLLGCAVQSDKKEEFIRKIKELDLGLQQAIVEQIKRVTDTVDCVLNVQALELDPADRTTATVLHQLQRVIKERDAYANSTLELATSTNATASEHESDGGGSTSSSSAGTGGSSSSSLCNGDVCQRKLPESQQDVRENSSERHHLAVELADVKARLRRTRQELEEKIELASEYREELTDKETALAKLRQENFDLLKDARAAKDYRDELDVLREKVDRLERLEHECGKYKERLTEFDFYKSRVEELREENHLLLESRHFLESQVDTLNARLQKNASAETELLQAQRLMLDLQQELKTEREKLSDFVERNSQLEKECQESLKKSSTLEKELLDVKAALNAVDGPRSNVGPLSDQINESANTKLLRLELENQRLRSRLDDAAPSAVVQQLKEENDRLKKQLNDQQSRNVCDSTEREDLLKQQRQELERNFRCLEDQYRREIDDLKTENTSLTDELSLTRDKYDESLADERRQVANEYESITKALSKERDELRLRKDEVSMENKRLAQELARVKSDLARTQDRLLENDKEKLANENRLYVLDRESRCAEKEIVKLKQMLDAADEEFEKARTKILELEREKQKLEGAHTRLEKSESTIMELEIEKKHFAQQSEQEMKKCAALREDLIHEKTQSQSLRTKLQSVLQTLGVVQVDIPFNQAETFVQECVSKAKRERDELQNRLNELELREKQNNELIASQKVELTNLRTKAIVDTNTNASLSNNEKLQDLQSTNSSLLDENKNVKQQVYLLQEELRKMQNQGQTNQTENGLLRQEINELRLQMSSNALAQSDNAKMQVELRSLQLQVDVLEQDNTELQKQCNQWERDHGLVRRDFEHLQRQHGGLLQDHEQLQNIHEQLAADFEKVQNELLILKSQLRQLKHDCSENNDHLERLAIENERLSNLQSKFDQERFEKEKEFKTFVLLQNEHSSLKKNYDDLKARYDFLSNEIDHMRSDYRNLRLDYNTISLKSTQLQAQLTDSQELAQRKDLEAVKLMHKCDMLTQLNSTLEEESRTLLRQMDVLIAQNQSLLTRALMDKDQYHAESKEFQEKLNALRRHKEKLEEKIMEQYKTMDSPSKRKEKLTFMKKAKALVSRPSARKSRPKQSLNSGSAAEDSAMSADEGGFLSTQPRAMDQYQNGNRFSSRNRDRAESIDSRRSASSSQTIQAQNSEYADIIRSSPSSGLKSVSYQTPMQERRQFRHTCSPLNSPETSHKRSHSSASTHGAESSLSSGTTAASSAGSATAKSTKSTNEKQEAPPLNTLPPFAPPNALNANLIPDHVSLTGSERAVDVPSDCLAQSSSHKSSATISVYGSAATKPIPPPYVPPRSSSQTFITAPAHSRATSSSVSKSTNSTISSTSPSLTMKPTPLLANKPRPPPPPYPGPITRRQPPPLPNSPNLRQQLNRLGPDVAAPESRNTNISSDPISSGRSNPMSHPTSLNVVPVLADTSFLPAQTSTPKSDQPFVFDSVNDDQNAVVVYPGTQASSTTQPFRLFCATATSAVGSQQKEQVVGHSHSYSNPYRKVAAHSFYENIDDLHASLVTDAIDQSQNAPSSPEGDGNAANVSDTTSSTVLPDSTHGDRDKNSIWYEYGCV